jgi:hypothetical protein
MSSSAGAIAPEISEDNMPLQDKLDAFKADFEGNKAPPQVVAVMRKATADLIASGQAERALKAGMRAPEFALPDAHGQIVRSADLLKEGPLVVTSTAASGVPTATWICRRSKRRRTTSAPLALL